MVEKAKETRGRPAATRRRDQSIRLSLTTDEKAAIEAAAETDNRTPAEFVRMVILTEIAKK